MTPRQEDPKVSHLEAVKRIFRYIKGTQHLGLWYPKDTRVNVLVYANSDHVGDVVDRKSTSGICTFVGSCLTSWFSKKQTSCANSITESDYVAAGRACQQALWMKQAFKDCNITLNEVPILCDDKCAINLTSSLIDYPRTKHIDTRHHFLKDNVSRKHITIEKIPLGENVANILTKPLQKDQTLGFMESGIWDKVKVPLSPRINEDEYSICCENTTHMMNALKEARMESREMFLSIHHNLKILLEIISKMNRKLEDEKIKRSDKGKDKVNDF
ncbi:hypothetical protein Tco_0303870 [Tanacetum coccineum]